MVKYQTKSTINARRFATTRTKSKEKRYSSECHNELRATKDLYKASVSKYWLSSIDFSRGRSVGFRCRKIGYYAQTPTAKRIVHAVDVVVFGCERKIQRKVLHRSRIMAARLCMLLCISVIGVSAEKKVEATFMKKTTQDLDTSATGYIYQQQGNNPAQVIYLNKGDVLGHLNEGEVLGRLNRGEMISDLNQGEILPHLHLKMNSAHVHKPVHQPSPLHQPALPYVYQQSAVNPGRSTSQSYYVTHYQDYGNGGGKKYTTHRPVSVSHLIGSGKGTDGDTYPHYDIAKHSFGVYNPLALQHGPQKPKQTPGLSHYPTIVKHAEPEDEYDENDEDENNHGPHQSAHLNINDDDDDDDDDYEGEDDDSHEKYDSHHHHTHDAPIISTGLGHTSGIYGNDRRNHHSDAGTEHEEEEHSQHGEKGSKGYDQYHEHDKGEKGHHDEAKHSNHYNQNSGHKVAGLDEAKQYGEHHEADQGEKGGEFKEKKAHKKGSKTTGYHNVFHKDEYKKVHTFYDDSDHKGKFKKYGSDHKEHESEAGETKKGAHHQSGHESDHHSKKGHTAKGHHDQSDQGYKKDHGEETYHEKEADYAKKGGKHGQSSHVFVDGGHY